MMSRTHPLMPLFFKECFEHIFFKYFFIQKLKINGNKKIHDQLERILVLMIRTAKGLELMNFFFITL